MKLFPLSLTLLALLLAAPRTATAQALDLGNEVSGYTRFLVYPHLQKGWESMQRGDRVRALAELERAHALAPDSPTVTLHLAAAYRKFGEAARGESLLREQIKRTPGDARLRTALAEAVPPAPAVTAAPLNPSPVPPAASVVRTPVAAAPRRVSRPATGQRQPPVQVTPAGITAQLRADFSLALLTHRFDDAQRDADALLAHEGGRSMLEELTYQLANAGAGAQTARVLLAGYPFGDRDAAERDILLQRLISLIGQQHSLVTAAQLDTLRRPLDTPALRSRQAVLWASLQDCDGVRTVLGDMSPEYGHDDWMRLGDCSTSLPAQHAYARAHALQPGGRASRALGYQAFAAGDFATAVAAWRSTDARQLSGDDLLSAVDTALAAGETEQAARWLHIYRDRGDGPNQRYWSLVGQSQAVSDPAAAAYALEQAIALTPTTDDYLRLARLERNVVRQVTWLEGAVALDRESGPVQAELAYAYTRAGRPGSALRAFERAAVLDPNNMRLQIELGYAYWRAGRSIDAQRALERAWRADPANLLLAQQLVYVHQRLKQNDQARGYAEQVISASASSIAVAGDDDPVAAADRIFGFQRLHEDLGRRVTLNLDGFSGTHVGAGPGAYEAGSRYRSYSQIEADVRLGSPAVRDGSTLSVYARVFADGGDLRSALPSQNAMLGVGLRWKPLRSQVMYLSAESQNGLDDRGRHDLLLRASASFLNGGRYSDDWHPSGSGWFSRNLYLDAAHYLEGQRRAFTADYRTGYHRKIWTGQTIEPYGHLQFTGADNRGFERDVRTGLGLRWNLWHGATPFDAPPHKLSLGVEFQQAFQTYLSDRNGVFLTFGSRW